MLWSAITYAGVGWMCKIDGNMDKILYKEILEDELEQTIAISTDKLGFRRDQVIFQQDNDPKHTSKLVTNYLQDQSYQVMQWPPQSPDLNPIENMWALLKRRLNDYETATKGMNELYERVTEVWYDQMKPEECQKVIESMPRRIQAVIKAKGKWTKY
jgi:transposase